MVIVVVVVVGFVVDEGSVKVSGVLKTIGVGRLNGLRGDGELVVVVAVDDDEENDVERLIVVFM